MQAFECTLGNIIKTPLIFLITKKWKISSARVKVPGYQDTQGVFWDTWQASPWQTIGINGMTQLREWVSKCEHHSLTSNDILMDICVLNMSDQWLKSQLGYGTLRLLSPFINVPKWYSMINLKVISFRKNMNLSIILSCV